MLAGSLLGFFFLYSFTSGLLRCSQVLQRGSLICCRTPPEFQLLRSCTLSLADVVASDRLPTLKDCVDFAVFHRGLALNFVSPKDLGDQYADTCLVYDCPEMDPLHLEANSLYDYYGIYTDLGADQNLTCVPKVGIFELHREASNYTEAAEMCEWEGGRLARIMSAERTNHLSAIVATLGNNRRRLHTAYVGLQDMEQEGTFVTSADEPLECFEYRGWAPGEPRSRKITEDCVVLDSRSSWRVRDCARKLPFLCELIAAEPDPCTHVKNKRFKQKCMSEFEANKRKERKNLEKCVLYDSTEYESEDSD